MRGKKRMVTLGFGPRTHSTPVWWMSHCIRLLDEVAVVAAALDCLETLNQWDFLFEVGRHYEYDNKRLLTYALRSIRPSQGTGKMHSQAPSVVASCTVLETKLGWR